MRRLSHYLSALSIVIGTSLTGCAHPGDTVDQALERCRLDGATSRNQQDETTPGGLFCRGIAAEDRNHNEAEAFKWFLKSAQADYAPAQFFVGSMYEQGDGVAKDLHKALAWHLKAAKQGLVEGQNQYAIILYYGRDGIEANPAMAVPWFQKAAAKGLANSQTMLGEAYYDGKGIAQNKAEAVKWYTLAANQHHQHAMYVLGILYLLGDGTAKNEEVGITWLKQSAETNYPVAQLNLAKAYLNGSDKVKDLFAADMWFNVYLLNTPGDRQADVDLAEKGLTPAQIADAKQKAEEVWKAMQSAENAA
ncbi:MAG: tetratricopeptide repeat protein [Asticcacaulis sp.]|uniref:tetratricopeptide repeat protein n=1 Tax=Asticcacaulis sp. TaxID=1872648 RepID=UPI0039E54213